MPEKIVLILSTARTGTKTLAEGLRSDDILSVHQPAFSRLLTTASNFYLHGWLPERALGWLVSQLREPQILQAECRYYVQAYSLDHLPAKIISQKYPNVYIIHIVRDPRTFVPSYLNWMHTRFKSFVANKFVPGWHPSGLFIGQVPWRTWLQMDEFEKVCWHWSYKNAFLERLFDGYEQYVRVRFEDLFGSDPRVLRSTLDFVGIPYREGFAALVQQQKNVSRKSYFPAWQEWEAERKQQLLEICGEGMRRYGYR
jgi:hypothetical protein